MSYISYMIDDNAPSSPLSRKAAPPTDFGFRPLYRQVKEEFVRRMVDGRWATGTALPSEQGLAAELGVSQGTVRKALDELAAENVLVRRQGRGTYVAEHDEARILFQFFRLVPDDGIARFPASEVLSQGVHAARKDERAALALPSGAKVARIGRVRSLGRSPVILETLSLPDRLFPGLTQSPVPNSLYAHYAAHYGITIAHTTERLKAVTLAGEDAARLDRPDGHPALRVERLATALDGRAVEWRVSLCLTDAAHYLVNDAPKGPHKAAGT